MITWLLPFGFFILSYSFEISTFKSPIIYVPGLGGTCLLNENKNQIWPPSLNDILFSDLDSNINLKVNDLMESTITSEIPDYKDIKNIQIIKNGLGFFTKKRFGETFVNNLKINKFPVYSFGYDFRIVPNQKYLDKLFDYYQNSIEEIYNKNSNKKIVIIAHSLGSLLINNFLNKRSKEWNLKYIDKIIYVNPPILGSVITLYLLAFDKIKIFFKDINIKFIKNFGGFLWCLPESKSNVLNIEGKDINTYGLATNKFTIKHNIESHLVLSDGIKTPSKIYLKKNGLKYKFIKYDYVNGDGVILPLNEQIINNFDNVHRLEGDHSDILESKKFFKKICEIVQY